METEGAKSERHGGQSGIRIALSELASEVMQHHFYILYLLQYSQTCTHIQDPAC